MFLNSNITMRAKSETGMYYTPMKNSGKINFANMHNSSSRSSIAYNKPASNGSFDFVSQRSPYIKMGTERDQSNTRMHDYSAGRSDNSYHNRQASINENPLFSYGGSEETTSAKMTDLLASLQKKREMKNKRQNIALIARLELAEIENKRLRDRNKLHKHNEVQQKLQNLRERDYKRMNPPQMKTLPIHQLPRGYDKYCLGTDKYLPEFFKKYEEDKKESKVIEDNRPEPRRMEKVLRYINNELNKNK